MPARVPKTVRKRATPPRRVGTRGRRAGAARTVRRDLELKSLQALRTIFASTRAHDAEVRRIAGISGSELWALSEIAGGSGLSVNGLAERMALHQTTASNLIYALVERKMVRRERDEQDLRVVRLTITTIGKALLLRAPGPYHGLLIDGLRGMSDADLPRLLECLGRLIQVMRQPVTAAAGETLLGE